MLSCNGCKHAEWEKTKTGKLHPSGDGKCKFEYKLPQLPAAFYFIGRSYPSPCGGYINRKEQNKNHCPYWQQVPVEAPKIQPIPEATYPIECVNNAFKNGQLDALQQCREAVEKIGSARHQISMDGTTKTLIRKDLAIAAISKVEEEIK